MPKRAQWRAIATDERRASNRLPLVRDVRYRVLKGKKSVKPDGKGKTLNISSGGVLFTTESALPPGELVELAICWPAQLNGVLPLKLVAVGRVVRAEDDKAAITIDKYEFKTRGSAGL